MSEYKRAIKDKGDNLRLNVNDFAINWSRNTRCKRPSQGL